jgi:hypothetical protein
MCLHLQISVLQTTLQHCRPPRSAAADCPLCAGAAPPPAAQRSAARRSSINPARLAYPARLIQLLLCRMPLMLLCVRMAAARNTEGTTTAATVCVTAIAGISATALVAWVLGRGGRGDSPPGARR